MSRMQISPRRLAWLRDQLDAWQADGLVSDEQARAIAGRYEPDTRASIAGLVYVLGALFLGVGVIWLVSTNVDYDEVSPFARFAVVAALWLAFSLAGAAVPRFGSPLRLLGTLLFGAVVFQTAQSLNVPAYEPTLLLAWAAGALAFAYGTRAIGPLVIGVTTGLGWYVWTLVERSENAAAFVLGMALATPVLGAVAVAHRGDRMAGPWLRIACVTGLGSLFVSALPGALSDRDDWLTRPVYAGIAVALVAVVAVAGWIDRRALDELGGATAIAVAVVLLVATAPQEVGFFDSDDLTGPALAHALVASALFLAAAVGVAALGVAREVPGLVNLAAFGLVLFVTLQSFGLFAPLLSGAGLFLVVGALLVGTGLLVERGRRRLREEIDA